ncbi:hypothetical protein FRZ02_27265 [Streptomyces albidoflavus]|uniref:Uncharacterized protein n=1 Tax=Streptomyces albidoflavus TaxID=1886 RepID=A0ABY3GQL6_9ACTN|nr:hypothetical protein C0R02_21520 [Streptomyces albidoflavus]TWV18393.1 hypothetical protein FRZ02_27265 [Streptomyces albidoflavus]
MESAPRVCGGGPQGETCAVAAGVCSPRVRGWSLRRRLRVEQPAVLPACAGVVPSGRRRSA